MTTLAEPAEQHFQLDFVDWDFYETVLENIGDRHVFVTFDDGSIELMSPSWEHDKRSRRLGLLLAILSEELGVDIEGGGSTTFKNKKRRVGLEPDQCFYIKHVQHVRGKKKIDLAVDPPPDLAIEVEISRRMIERMPLYAKLRVPEIWRDDGKHIHVHVLQEDGVYAEAQRSLSFPSMPIKEVARFLELAETTGELAWIRTVRQWVKDNLVLKP